VTGYSHIDRGTSIGIFLQEFYLVLIQIQGENQLFVSVAYGSKGEKTGALRERLGGVG
jgi:hypothetical protein